MALSMYPRPMGHLAAAQDAVQQVSGIADLEWESGEAEGIRYWIAEWEA